MLPDGWTLYTIDDLFNVQLGKMLNKTARELTPQFEYIGNSNVKWGRFVLSDLKTMFFSEKEIEKFELHDGDIIMCEGGEVGRCAIWRNQSKTIYYQKALHRLRTKGKVIPEFFQNFMEYIASTKLIEDLTSRTSIAHLTREKLLRLQVKTPSLPEQKKIAKILSTWDKAITTTEQLIANSQQQKKALMQQLLTGKKRLAGFDGEWEVVSVSKFGKVVTGNTPPKADSSNYGDYVCWATAPDFKDKYIQSTGVMLSIRGSKKARVLPAGSVLVTCIASIGKNAIASVDMATNQQINSVIVSKNHSNEFFFYIVGYYKQKLIAWAGTTAVPILNKSSFEKIKFLAPTKQEQQQIAQVLSSADQEIEILQQKLNFLKQEKKALMQQLLTGKRRVKINDREDA